MARYTDASCRLCRREKQKLFLKGTKCFTEKCPVERRAFPPGQHGQSRRTKISEYGVQLREKQKVRRIYGVLEAQFRGAYEKAAAAKGITFGMRSPPATGTAAAATNFANPAGLPAVTSNVQSPNCPTAR